MAEAERELQVRALGRDAVTDAVDLELLLVALGDTHDHVVDQGPGQAVQRAALPLVVGPHHLERAVLGALDGDGLGDRVVEGALGPLHRHELTVDRDVDASRNGDRQLTDA